MRNKIAGLFSGLTVWIYSLITALILGVVLFSRISYSCQRIFKFSNITLLITGVILLALATIVFSFVKTRKDPINVLTLILFLVESYIAFNIYMGPQAWDEGTLIGNIISAANGNADALAHSYFSQFPNQQLILFVDALLFKLDGMIGIFDTDINLLLIILVQYLLAALGGKWTYEIIRDQTKSFRAAIIGWIAYVALIGLSPWGIIIYTDPMGLVFPIAILRLYQLTKMSQKRFCLRWAVIAAAAYIGFKIKPTAIIVLIAIIGIELIGFIKECNKEKLVRGIKVAVISGLVFFVSSNLCSAAVKSTGLKIDPEKDTGALNMVMTGLNPVNDGIWYAGDMILSTSIEDKAERTRAQKTVIRYRLEDYGVSGLIKHQWKRTLTTFNDGTFAWGMEGGFYQTIYPEKNTLLSPVLRGIYYDAGSYFIYWSTFVQMIWITVLFLSIGIVFVKRNKLVQVIALSLIGTIIFNEIFEARARYIYLYVPFFIIAAVLCWDKVCVGCENGVQKIYKAGKLDKPLSYYEKYKDLIPYIVFGVLTTLVNVVTYWIFAHPFGLSVMGATILAWFCAVLFAYVTNRKWVFHSEAVGTYEITKEIVLFFSARLATGLVDWLCMFIFVDLMNLNDVVIKALANVVVIILNYVASKFLIFKHKK